MPNGYRNGVFALGLIAGVGVATFSVLWIFGLNYCPNEPCHYQQAADDSGQDGGQRVWQMPNAVRGTFSYETEPEYAGGNPTHHEYYDLRTQERMAHATDWIAWFTFFTSAISAFGLGALAYTLYLQRDATKAARDAVAVTRGIGEAQVRAYPALNAAGAGVTLEHVSAERTRFRFEGVIVNHG